MATATIEEQQQDQASGRNVLFKSRRSGLRLTMTPRRPVRDPISGEVTGRTAGKFVAFKEGPDGGYFNFPATGTVKLVDSLDGGESEIEAEDLIEWLEGHRLFGNLFEGFWRETVQAPVPTKDELDLLLKAAIELDVSTLREFIEREEAGWAREDLLSTAREALSQVEGALERAQAQADAAQAEAAAQAEVERERKAAEAKAKKAAEAEAKKAADAAKAAAQPPAETE